MADYNLGTAKGVIKVDYDGKGVASAKKDVASLGSASASSNASLQRTGLLVGAAAGAAAAGLVFAAKTAIDFEKRVSAIAAVSGATAAQIELLRKKALQLGRDTAFSASEAAQAMEELAKAGVSLPDILNGAADATVALAAAGGVDLPVAAEIAANAMNSFALSARDMPKIADLIAGAANASAIDVNDFGLALKQSGAVANLVGLSFKDLAVAIALMGNAGIKGSDAGTSLKTMLSNLQPTTRKQIALFKQLGLITRDGSNAFFDAKGNVKGLGEIAGILQDKLKGMTAQQKALTLEMIFGSDAIRAAAILTQAGAKGFDDMAKAMGKVSAADVARKRLDNVAGAIEQLKGSAETLAISIGTAMLPTIKVLAQVLTGVANALSSVDPRIQKVALAIIVVTTAITGLIAGIALLRSALVFLDIAGLFNPVSLIILGIVAAIALVALGVKKAWDNSQGFRDAVMAVRDVIRDNIIPAIQQFVSMVQDQLRPRFEEFVSFIRSNAEPTFQRIRDIVVTQIIPALHDLNDWWNQNKDSLQPLIAAMGDMALNTAKILAIIAALSAISGLQNLALIIRGVVFALNFLSDEIGVIVSAFHAVSGFIGSVIDRLTSFGHASSGVASEVSKNFQGILAPIRAVFGFIAEVARTFWSIISAIFSVGFTIISAINGAALSAISAAWHRVWSTIGGPVTSAFNFVRGIISTSFNLISGIVSAGMSFVSARVRSGFAVIAAVFNALSGLLGKVRGFFDGLKTAAQGGVGSLVAFVGQIPSRILGALGNLGGLLVNAGRDVVNGFISGIRGMIGRVADAARSIANAIPGPIKKILGISSPSKVTRGFGKDTGEGFALGVLDQVELIRRASAEAARAVQAALANIPVNSSVAVSAALNGAVRAASGVPAPAGGSAPVASGSAGAPAISQTFNVPAPMNAKEVAAYSARRLNLALSGATNTGGSA